MQPGIYDNITNEQYHSGPGVSKSSLDLIAKSPALYRGITTGEIERKSSPAFALGTAFHMYCLEPQEFSKAYSRPLNRETIERSGVKIVPDGRDAIAAMVASVNIEREKAIAHMPNDTGALQEIAVANGLAKSGSKAALIARIREAGIEVEIASDFTDKWESENGQPYILKSTATIPQMIDWLNHAKYQGGNWRTWQQILDEWTVNNPGRVILDNDTWDKLNKMRDSLMNHPKASKLLWDERGGVAEQSIYWIDEETGELCRCRPDWNPNWINVLVDLKTTADASPEGFAKSVSNFRYDVQEQFYLDGAEAATGTRPDHMVFIAVETEAPYNCATYILGPEFAQIGRGKYRENLRTLHECKEKNSWPGYSEQIETLNPAGWYAQRNAQFLDNGNW